LAIYTKSRERKRKAETEKKEEEQEQEQEEKKKKSLPTCHLYLSATVTFDIFIKHYCIDIMLNIKKYDVNFIFLQHVIFKCDVLFFCPSEKLMFLFEILMWACIQEFLFQYFIRDRNFNSSKHI